MRPRLSCPCAGVLRHDERTSRSFLPQARGWRATGKMGSHGAFWWSCTGWGRGAPAWFTWISWLGAAPAAGGVQAQGLGSSRPLRIQGAAPCVLSTDNPPDRRLEVMRGAGWARASNLRDLYGWRWACTPSVQGGEARDRYKGPIPFAPSKTAQDAIVEHSRLILRLVHTRVGAGLGHQHLKRSFGCARLC